MVAATQLTKKGYRRGTHRLVPPELTWRRIEPLLSRFGITRVAPVTGLDVIGIPTVMVVRPASRNLSVAQGKGADLIAARVSGVMEALEQALAEDIREPLIYGSARDLSARQPLAEYERLTPGARTLDSRQPCLWMNARDLRAEQSVLCPYEVIHLDLRLTTQRPGAGCFAIESHGLASGNDVEEASCHALFELLERDATARFYALPVAEQVHRRVHLDSIDDPLCRELLQRYDDAGVMLAVWDVTADLGFPVFLCDALDKPMHALRGLSRARGIGCHSTRAIALARALCEAAQSRLTLIAGARDDISASALANARTELALEHARAQLAGDGTRRFAAAPSHDFESFHDELRCLLERIGAAGYEQILRVELASEQQLPFSVVRMVVPGLSRPESHGLHAQSTVTVTSTREVHS